MRVVIVLTLACLPALFSCGGGSAGGGGAAGSGSSGAGLARFSGTWTGTATRTPTGTCSVVDNPLAVTLNWTATDAGELSINEQPFGATWSGTVTNDLSVSVTRTNMVTCDTTVRTNVTVYSGVIREGASRQIDLAADENLCPPNCTFRVVYSLTQQ